MIYDMVTTINQMNHEFIYTIGPLVLLYVGFMTALTLKRSL